MRIKLNKPVNVLGLEWPAGEYEVQDQFWAEALLAAQEEPEPEAKQQDKTKKKRGEVNHGRTAQQYRTGNVG